MHIVPLQSDFLAPSGSAEAKNADRWEIIRDVFPERMHEKYEIWSYDGGAAILSVHHPKAFRQLLHGLMRFEMTPDMLVRAGGSKSDIVKVLEAELPSDWQESRIISQLHYQKIAKTGKKVWEEGHKDFAPSHNFDLVSSDLAIEIAWNTKYYLFERDLTGFRLCRNMGAVDVGVIITRGFDLEKYCRNLPGTIPKIGTDGVKPANKKYTQDTTNVKPLLKALDSNHHGNCPMLVFGVTRHCIKKEGR